MTPEKEITTRVTDPNNGDGTISIRILYTLVCGDVTVLGVFRSSDDSEIPFESLSLNDQCQVEEACDKDNEKQTKEEERQNAN